MKKALVNFNTGVYKSRLRFIFVGVLLMWGLLFVRGLQLKVFPNQKLETARHRQYQRVVKLKSKRGDIFDRRGQELAISVAAYSLFADPSLIKKPRKVALKLSRLTGMSYKSLLKKLKKKKTRFVWLKRLQSKTVRDKILSWKVRGLGYKEEFRRVYPNKNLLSHALGFVGTGEKGLEGIESVYNDVLSPKSETMHLPRDARGRFLVNDGWLFMRQTDGDDLFLTVDGELQFFVERELKKAIEKHEADGAWAVVLDPKTSEILALSSQPDYDVNRRRFAGRFFRRHRAVSDVYEPGSTMKTIFMASALREGLVEPNTLINTRGGKVKINGRTISEADKDHIYDKLTATEVLSYSSNVGISKMALKMDSETIYEMITDFGFGQKTGVDLTGEAKGLLRRPPWRDHLKANISFGHGLAVSALQVANAYAAIANGGVLKRPYIVKERRGIDGRKIINEPEKIRRVLTKKEADRLKIMLMSVTGRDGTGTQARVKGFPVAGKTGTAQKVKPKGRGYMKGAYISSFVGFLPANDPQFLIYVVVDHPKKNGKYASQTAAPVFSRIAEFALNGKGVAPVMISQEDLIQRAPAVEPQHQPEELNKIPNMSGWTLREAIRYANRKDIRLDVKGRKGRVVKTVPESGVEWMDKKEITVFVK